RRHTRFSRDWSSDVCSSDLGKAGAQAGVILHAQGVGAGRGIIAGGVAGGGGDVVVAVVVAVDVIVITLPRVGGDGELGRGRAAQIGRASCRKGAEMVGVVEG